MSSTKTYYLNKGSTLQMTDDLSLKIQDSLYPGCYSIMASMEGLYLQAIPALSFEGKIYGDVEKRADRVINTYLDRKSNTGLLLDGEKGAGKTLLLKILSSKLLKMGISTLVVNAPYAGDAFNKFISNIQQPAMILFDEFEKTYDSEKQEALLTLFDGLYHTKKLFAVSINDYGKILGHLKNRPGRMYYHFKYESLDEATIVQYVQENLKNKDRHDSTIISIINSFSKINFDMLKAIVEEMNRYDEPLRDVVSYVNASPGDLRGRYKILDLKAKKVDKNEEIVVNGDIQNLNPMLTFQIQFYTFNAKGKKLDDDKKEQLIKRLKEGNERETDWSFINYTAEYIKPEQLVGYERGVFSFDTGSVSFRLQREKPKAEFDWRSSL